MAAAGCLHEIFRSIQGEGPYVGTLQIFVRTAGCSLRCRYCDTTRARERGPDFSLRGDGSERRLPNPVDGEGAAALVGGLVSAFPGVHSIAVTGGEPLEQLDFLRDFFRALEPWRLPRYLETNGLFEDAAREVAPLVDIVSMDIKLPSLCGGGDLFETYRRVLPLFGRRELFCKVVVADGFDRAEFAEATRLVAAYDARTPFIIQPATPTRACASVDGETLLACHAEAARLLEVVRVIPQCHPLLGLP